MADSSSNRTERAEEARSEEHLAEDSRQPYEAPRLVKKRSVARATLLTAMGPTATTLVAMG